MAIATLKVGKLPETPEFETCPYDPQMCTRNLLMPQALGRVYCLKSHHPGFKASKTDPNSTSVFNRTQMRYCTMLLLLGMEQMMAMMGGAVSNGSSGGPPDDDGYV